MSQKNKIREPSGNIIGTYTEEAGSTNLTEQPIYGSGRIGLATPDGSGIINKYSYELTDHLGNVRATFGNSSDGLLSINTAADYYPFGMEMYGRTYQNAENYRFGYQGQNAEEDPETGYTAFDARLLDKRIGRWLTTDPAGQFWSPYVSMGNNPINSIDPDGEKAYVVNQGNSQYPRYGLYYTDGALDAGKVIASISGYGALALMGYDAICGYSSISKKQLDNAMSYISTGGSVMDVTSDFVKSTNLGKAFKNIARPVTAITFFYEMGNLMFNSNDYDINSAIDRNFHFMVFRTKAEAIVGYSEAYLLMDNLINSGDLIIEKGEYGVRNFTFTEYGQGQVDQLNDVFKEAYFESFDE